MTEMEMMYILKEREFHRLTKLKKAIEEDNEWGKKYWLDLYHGVIYLRGRFHTKFKTGDKSLEELVKIAKQMEDYYDKLADKALERGDLKAEAKWLGVYLEAGFLYWKLKSMLKREEAEKSLYKVTTWKEVREYIKATS